MQSLAKTITSFDETTIYYEIDKHPYAKKHLIFVHGLSGDLSAWQQERKALQKLGYATVALDLRGHGFSEHPNKKHAYELENFAKDIMAVMEYESIKDAVLIGHCFGGMVTLLFAEKYQKGAHAIILVDTSYKAPYFSTLFPHHTFLTKMFTILAEHMPAIALPGHTDYQKFIGTGDYNLRRIAHDLMHTSLYTYFSVCEQLTHFDASTLLKKIHIPSLVIEGANDTIFPPKLVKDLSKRLRNSHYQLVPNANHVLVINNPADIVEDIHQFLNRTRF